MRLLETLARPNVIFVSLIAMLLTGASFGVLQKFTGGTLLDMSLNGSDALARLTEMNPAQRRAHFWITLIPDSLYPITYGSFFAGATLYLAKSKKLWLGLPAMITVIADFTENCVQMIALNGADTMLKLKTVITPIKFTSFLVMTALFLLCAVMAFIRYGQHRSGSSHE